MAELVVILWDGRFPITSRETGFPETTPGASGLSGPVSGNATYRPLTAWQNSPLSVNPTPLMEIFRRAPDLILGRDMANCSGVTE